MKVKTPSLSLLIFTNVPEWQISFVRTFCSYVLKMACSISGTVGVTIVYIMIKQGLNAKHFIDF